MLDATPFFRLYAARRAAKLRRQDSIATQERLLLSLVDQARETRFGRDHGFAEIKNWQDFRKRVPLRRYEDLWEDYWKAAFPVLTDVTWPGTNPYFAVSSGTTTGRNKYIPCNKAMLRANQKCAIDIIVHHLAARPQSRLLGGRSFMFSGCTDLTEEAPGVFSGDLSGIIGSRIPWLARPRYFPPADLALIPDWEEKMARIAPLALKSNIRMLAGTPSWVLLFIETLEKLCGERRLSRMFPELEVIVHGAVNFAPYRSQFAQLLEGSHAETREVYPASEGFIAVADRGDGEGLRLIVDAGVAYEFVPADELDGDDPPRLSLDEVEIGVNYAVVMSTCAGLWGYVIGDTVRFVELDPPRLLMTGRTSYMLSAFGEHLIDSEIEEAIAEAARSIDASVIDYVVAPIYPDHNGARGHHRFLVEFSDGMPDGKALEQFTSTLDRTLAAVNEDYAAHRAGLSEPDIRPLPAGSFAAWMKNRGKMGAQHKVPRIMNDQELFEGLEAFMDKR